jgi:hypothetical protein
MNHREQMDGRAGAGRRRRVVGAFAGGVVAGGLAIGLALAGWSAWSSATAESAVPNAAVTGEPGMKAWPDGMKPHPDGGRPGPGFFGVPRLRGPGGFGFGKLGGPGIHGEVTSGKPGGGYQTLAMQAGEVTSVSSSSIAVRSEDGFTRTYSVDDKTRVMAGTNGISDVKKGDSVRVLAVVEGDKARSLRIVDLSNLKNLRGKVPPLPRKPGQAPPPDQGT